MIEGTVAFVAGVCLGLLAVVSVRAAVMDYVRAQHTV